MFTDTASAVVVFLKSEFSTTLFFIFTISFLDIFKYGINPKTLTEEFIKNLNTINHNQTLNDVTLLINMSGA